MIKIAALLVICFVSRSLGEIFDPARIIDWTYAGVPGGIPARATIFTTLTTANTLSDINTAIDNCPSGQVVLLSAGTYNLSGAIHFDTNSGITLRGAGVGQTILNFTVTGAACIDADQYGFAGAANIASGYTKGATAVVMSGTPNAQVAAGNIIRIDEDDDTALVKTTGAPSRRIRFLHRVTSVSGNTVNFTPPLAYTLTAGLTPQVSYQNGGPGLSLCGIEDLSIVNAGAVDDVIQWFQVSRCWVKNVDMSGVASQGIHFESSIQCEVRRCHFHDAVDYPNNPDGFAIYAHNQTTWCLVEDNIFDEVGVGFLQTASSCNAVLYNYFARITFNAWPYQTGGINSNHGAQPMFNLFEGNVTEQFQCDGVHGSASHQTLFRNWFSGVSLRGVTDNKKCVSLERGSYYFNIVGNVLGCSWGAGAWSGPGAFNFEMSGGPGYAEQSVIRRLGYPNVANNSLDAEDVAEPWPLIANTDYPDASVVATLQWHGNYDTKNAAIVWDAGNADHALPNSMYYAAKPAYFASLTWPPFDPANPTSASVASIPAGYRYENGGQDPPESGGGLQTLNIGTLRVAP